MEYFTITGVQLKTLDGFEFKFDTPIDRTSARLMMVMYTSEREMYKYRSLKGHEFLRQEGKAVRPVFPYVKPKDRLIPNTSKYKNTDKTTWQIGRELVETYLKVQNLSKSIKMMMEKYGAEKEEIIYLLLKKQMALFILLIYVIN